MKKLFVISLVLILLVYISSCQQIKTIRTIENLKLTNDEQRIADLTSDILKKYVFEKDKIYDIQLYLYQNGTIESFGGMYEIDTKGRDEIILISGRKDGNVSFAWNILSMGISKFPAIEIDDDRTFMMVNGIGKEKFFMEEGREYVLVFVAFKEGTQLQSSLTEVFYLWDTIEDKIEALKEFNYAYIVTVKFSDLTTNQQN